MKLYTLARKINKKIKQRRKEHAGRYLSPVRRLERFSVPVGERLAAMTFDDGPTALPANPATKPGYENVALTTVLLEILAQYNAKGTFNVIGTTEHNYPDKKGALHKPTWSGIRHDHYPQFGMDEYAGAKNQKELVKALIDGGHEISSHGYRHVLFGKNNLIYGSREHFSGIGEAVSDLTELHNLLLDEFNYKITMSRPPHYIDRMPDGFTSYDAYALMGYDYLAASFDGGGWMPATGDYNEDVRKMTKPLAGALKADPNSLNGQIIFQKDGYNMSLMSPVATALEEQLKILDEYGYSVVTVRKLKELYPFEDFHDKTANFDVARELDRKGFIIGYKTNEFKPARTLTVGEMIMMTLTREDYKAGLAKICASKKDKALYLKHPYYLGLLHYNRLDLAERLDEAALKEDIRRFYAENFGMDPSVKRSTIKRFEYLEILAGLSDQLYAF